MSLKNVHFKLNFASISFAWCFLLMFFVQTSFALDAYKEQNLEKSKAVFEGKLEPSVARAGEEVRFVISAKMDEGYHVYSVIPSEDEDVPPPTKITINAKGLIKKGPVYETNPIVENDEVIGMILAYHEKKGKFYQNFKIPEDYKKGTFSIDATVTFQACNDRICLPPKTIKIPISYQVEEGPIRPAYTFMNRVIDEIPSEGFFIPNADSLENALSEGIMGFILLAIIMGVLAWLTPCVFPMIPITISFFSKQAHNSHRKLIILALVFSLGIVITYTGLGLLLTVFMGAAGAVQLATNPWVNIGIALLFTLFGLSLIGLFELRLPNFIVQSTDSYSRKNQGFLSVSLMGMVFTLTAFTCTVQFVGTLLIAASQGEWVWPIIGMLIFSTVFAFPFFFLALFPKWINSLKTKSGSWMNQVKVILGIIELMAVFKFLSNADLVWGLGYLNRTVVLSVWSVLSLFIVIYILHNKIASIIKRVHKNIPRTLLASLFLFFAIYFGQGVFGKSLDNLTESYLPPNLESKQAINSNSKNLDLKPVELVHELPWFNKLDSALLRAKELNKPVFIDFTGYTCVNCRWMEKNVFAESNVFKELSDKFVLTQLYTDSGEGYEENQNLQIERFKTIALPFYVILSPENTVLAKTSGISSPQKFLIFLRQAQKNNI